MSRYEDNLLREVMDEHGHMLDEADSPPPRRGAARVLRRPRLLAGSSLGLAGIGAGLVLLLGAGSAAAPTPASATVTKHSDGTVLVQLNDQEDLGQANQKLAAMGINEQIVLSASRHPTAYRGVENCTAASGAAPDPAIQLSVVTNDADNTGVTGAVSCVVVQGSGSSTGN